MELQVSNVPQRMRYEARAGGEVMAFAQYARSGKQITFLHTKVESAHKGKGIGGRLVRGALDDVRGRGMEVVVRCPFVADWIERHPDYADLLHGSGSGTAPVPETG